VKRVASDLLAVVSLVLILSAIGDYNEHQYMTLLLASVLALASALLGKSK
jgi:hypothetical protein